jgi:murein DD-endopeptidase MepM/ murein hydrolase activator NlpD
VATPRRTALFALVLGAAVLVAAAGASGQSVTDRRESLDGKISALRSQIDTAKQKEGVLSTEIAAASTDISSLEGDIGSLTTQVAALESELAAHRARLARLQARFEEQTRDLERLRRDHDEAQRRLDARLVELYESEQADTLAIALQVQSLGELIDHIDFVNEIGRQDRRISATLKRLKIAMREARERTAEVKAQVAEATAVIADKTAEAQAARAELVARQAALEAARASKRELLVGVRDERHEDEEDLDAMLAASARLAAQIQAVQSSSSTASSGAGATADGGDSTPSSSGLIWPVSGVLTSGFGPRWGRMHEGIDISAPTGTSVQAAAGGTVIYAGSLSGYGSIVVIDHGGGLSTAYAHLSAIWVGGGSVSQGQGIGAVGCTGHCTGPHLHFEVRVNGSPVNPLGYL